MMPASLSPGNMYLNAFYPSLITSKMRVQILFVCWGFFNQKQNGEKYLNDSGFLVSLPVIYKFCLGVYW